jgi:hypothetical protein
MIDDATVIDIANRLPRPAPAQTLSVDVVAIISRTLRTCVELLGWLGIFATYLQWIEMM